jgi:hypothetical protein
MKISITLAFTAAVGLMATSCYYPQPAKTGQSSAFNGTTAVAGALGGAGGAFAGQAINKDYGAPVGAAIGTVAAGGITYALQERKQRELQEACAEGERQGRAQVLDEWWTENAVLNDPADKDGKKGPKTRQIPLPEGVYESVPYHRRSYDYIVKP